MRTRGCCCSPRSSAHPRGIGNAHDRSGRHFMAHVTAPFALRSLPGYRAQPLERQLGRRRPASTTGTRTTSITTGSASSAAGCWSPRTSRSRSRSRAPPLPPGCRASGTRWKAWLAATTPLGSGTATAQMECLPYEENRLDLDPRVRDSHGVPVIRVTHRVHENEHRGSAFLSGRLERWLRAAGADEVWHGPQPFVEARHCYGRRPHGRRPGNLGGRPLRVRTRCAQPRSARQRRCTRRRAATTRR